MIHARPRPDAWRSRVALLLAALSLAAVSCKKRFPASEPGEKSPPARPAPVVPKTGTRCNLPAEVLTKLRASQSLAKVSAAEQARWKKLALKSCKGWPPLIRKMLALHEAGPDAPNRALPPITRADRKDFHERLERLCPGIGRSLNPAAKHPEPTAFVRIWNHCRFARLKLLALREFTGAGMSNMMTVVIYRSLRDGGLDHAASRTLARLYLIRDLWSTLAQQYGLRLPRSTSVTPLKDAPDVIITADGILVRNQPIVRIANGKADAKTKRRGPRGLLIDPLHRRLRELAKALKAAAKKAKGRWGRRLLVVTDAKTRFRLFSAVLYTALGAGFQSFQLAVWHPLQTDTVIAFALPAKRPLRPLSPRETGVVITADSYLLRPGKGAATQTIAIPAGQEQAALGKLSQGLAAALAKQGDSKTVTLDHALHFAAASDTTMQRLVRVLDTARMSHAPKGSMILHLSAR